MEALWSAAQTFDSSRNIKFSTYATVCIINALGSYMRGLKVRSKTEVLSYNANSQNGEGDEYLDSLASGEPPEVTLEKEERLAQIHQIFEEQLACLSSKQRVIVEVWRTSGYEAQKTEIAKQVGVSQSYVSSTLAIFKNKFKIELELEGLIDV